MERKNKIILSVFALAVLILLGGCGVKKNISKQENYDGHKPGDYGFSLLHDGLKRTYRVHIPPLYNKDNPAPVIINFHGGGGNAESHIKTTLMNKVSDREGFIVVYPDGTGKEVLGKQFYSWNAGRCCAEAREKNVDDVDFTRQIIEKIKKDFNIDERRIYAAGFSNGAQMAYRLACELSDKIAAVAPIASVGSLDDCNPQRPVPILHIDGTDDPCSPYDGGEKCGACFADIFEGLGVNLKADTYACESVDSYIEKWRGINNCQGENKTIYQNKSAVCKSFSQCKNNAEIKVCTLKGMRHVWPGGTYGIPACESDLNGKACRAFRDVVGELNNDIDANQIMWEFFKAHQLN